MKTRWDFWFTSWDIKFDMEHRFDGNFESIDGTNESIPFELVVVPMKERVPTGADSAGEIQITLQGDPEHTKDYAHAIVSRAKEQIAFPKGRIGLVGYVASTKIPENAAEQEQVGDRGYSVTLHLKERVEPTTFNPKGLVAKSLSPQNAELLAQYNVANSLQHPVEQYLSFFKIIESAFAGNKSGSLLPTLTSNKQLMSLLERVFILDTRNGSKSVQQAGKELLRTFVRVRHNCAHTRGKTGYTTGDPRISKELLPGINSLRALVYAYLSEV